MTAPVIVPIHLGCCPQGERRCKLCSPPPSVPSVAFVTAMIENYQQHPRYDGTREMWVSFFGGAPPPTPLLRACQGLPITVRVRPDLLDKSTAETLLDLGVAALELDALSLKPAALKSVGRLYRPERVLKMLKELRAMGFRVGAVLSPGLPYTRFQDCIDDASRMAELVDTIRIHPALVYADAAIREAHMDGTYVPLTLGEAVTVCAAMMDIFEENNVSVIRVGVQPGPDETGRVVAGPFHPSFRELVEGRRTLQILLKLGECTPPGQNVIIRCHPRDETRTRGPFNQNIRTLRADYKMRTLTVHVDAEMARGSWRLEVKK